MFLRNEIAKIPLSLRKSLANGRLRHKIRASDCECDGVVHSGALSDRIFAAGSGALSQNVFCDPVLVSGHRIIWFSEKPRIRLGYTVRSPSRSAFSKAPRKLVLVDFDRKEYGYQTSWSRFGGGSNNTPGALP